MLDLKRTYSGCPTAGIQHLVLANETLLVRLELLLNFEFTYIYHPQLYPSADAVVILNACTLALIRVLAFWEAFPAKIHTSDKVTCISVDSGMKLVRS